MPQQRSEGDQELISQLKHDTVLNDPRSSLVVFLVALYRDRPGLSCPGERSLAVTIRLLQPMLLAQTTTAALSRSFDQWRYCCWSSLALLATIALEVPKTRAIAKHLEIPKTELWLVIRSSNHQSQRKSSNGFTLAYASHCCRNCSNVHVNSTVRYL